jgi:hypothetical protein
MVKSDETNLDDLNVFEFITRAQTDPSIVGTTSYSTLQAATKLRNKVLKDLYDSPFYSKGGNPAAEWRLRVQRQRAVDAELVKLGPLALLCAGGLLTAARNGAVHKVSRATHWKETMFGSPLFYQLDKRARIGLMKIEFPEYTRLELGIQSFGQMICLAVSNLGDRKLVDAFNKLKLWCVTTAVSKLGKTNCIQQIDEVLTYLKWLAKACQSVFLKSEVLEEPEIHPDRIDGAICPFVSELTFASDLIIRS